MKALLEAPDDAFEAAVTINDSESDGGVHVE